MGNGLKITFKTLGWTLVIVFLLILSAMVALQSPAIQSFIGRQVVERLRGSIDADIQFGEVSFKPVEALIIKDVLVTDPSAVSHKADTVFRAKHLSAKFSIRGLFSTCAKAFMKAGENDRALEMLDMCSTVMHRFPLCAGPLGFSGNDYMVVQMADQYYKLGQPEKARELAVAFGDELMQSIMFYMQFYEYARSDFESSVNYLYFLIDTLEAGGDKDLAESYTKALSDLVHSAVPAK